MGFPRAIIRVWASGAINQVKGKISEDLYSRLLRPYIYPEYDSFPLLQIGLDYSASKIYVYSPSAGHCANLPLP